MIRYWTLQTEEVWELAQQRGYLVGSQEYAMYPDEYRWMMDQMKKRLLSYKGEFPIWLWLDKPDMRSTANFKSGTKCVRLAIELDEQDVLVSDFEDWHCVLNNWFCSDNDDEDNAVEEGLLEITKEESWLRIFELNRMRDPDWHGTAKRKLQGVTGKIDLSQVKKVEPFVAR